MKYTSKIYAIQYANENRIFKYHYELRNYLTVHKLQKIILSYKAKEYHYRCAMKHW